MAAGIQTEGTEFSGVSAEEYFADQEQRNKNEPPQNPFVNPEHPLVLEDPDVLKAIFDLMRSKSNTLYESDKSMNTSNQKYYKSHFDNLIENKDLVEKSTYCIDLLNSCKDNYSKTINAICDHLMANRYESSR